jgi:multiple sugar transport system ATP-binding protein
MATIVLRGLRRRYEGAEGAALQGLDLTIEDGELLCVVGPSGCGKSTTLRLVAGLDAPDAGTIEIDGRDVSRTPPQERDVAMVFQGYALYPHLTVAENIAFPLKMRGVARETRARRVEETAAMLGLGKLLGRRPGELSGGERQRVAMGRAIVRAPKAFLFDEPLSNLDAALRAELRVEIGALVRRLGTTSLYVTHDQVEAMTLGDRIAVMKGGVLQQVGPPRAIYEDPNNRFVASFLGSPPIQFVELDREDGAMRANGIALPIPAIAETIEWPRRAVAGIRPERLSLVGESDELSAGRVRFGAVVVAVEPLGAETIVHVDAKGTRLVARAPGFDSPAVGARVSLALDASRVLWFEVDTGARIRAGGG